LRSSQVNLTIHQCYSNIWRGAMSKALVDLRAPDLIVKAGANQSRADYRLLGQATATPGGSAVGPDRRPDTGAGSRLECRGPGSDTVELSGTRVPADGDAAICALSGAAGFCIGPESLAGTGKRMVNAADFGSNSKRMCLKPDRSY
jgi:hypothetical protein